MSDTTNVVVLFYSMYGHTHKLAQAVADGVDSVGGCKATLMQVAEINESLVQGIPEAVRARDEFKEVPVCTPAMLKNFDAVVVGTPTRFGNMCSQMRRFWDLTGQLWVKNSLAGKVGSVFVTASTQHGGLETTALSVYNTFAHHGMIIVPIGYRAKEMSISTEIFGGTPYGAGSISNADGSQMPTEAEISVANLQGELVAQTARALKLGSKLMAKQQ